MTATPTPVPTSSAPATPTPMSMSVATPVIEFGYTGDNLAAEVVGGYNYVNQYGTIDTVITMLLFMGVLMGIWSIIKRVQSMDENS